MTTSDLDPGVTRAPQCRAGYVHPENSWLQHMNIRTNTPCVLQNFVLLESADLFTFEVNLCLWATGSLFMFNHSCRHASLQNAKFVCGWV